MSELSGIGETLYPFGELITNVYLVAWTCQRRARIDVVIIVTTGKQSQR